MPPASFTLEGSQSFSVGRLRLRLGSLYAVVRAYPFYAVFEQIVVHIIVFAMIMMVLSGLWHLGRELVNSVILEDVNAPEHLVFQNILGSIFSILITMEFKRSLLVAKQSAGDVIRVRPIILIAMMASVRRFIVADLADIEIIGMLGMAAVFLSLGIVYWLVSHSPATDG
jgi:uncharacterized membrane protein (DUF373 family)